MQEVHRKEKNWHAREVQTKGLTKESDLFLFCVNGGVKRYVYSQKSIKQGENKAKGLFTP